MPAENMTVTAQWAAIPDTPDTPPDKPDEPEPPTLSTEIYAVKQNADGTWTAAALLETSGNNSYQVTELYRNEHLSASAYSFGADRTPISAGDSVNLADANGKLYVYYARDAFDLTVYADVAGTKVLKTEKILYGASLSEYAALTLPDTDLYTFAGWTPDKNVTTYRDGNGATATEIAWDGLTMPTEPLDVYPILVTNYINVKLNLGADDAQMDASQGRSFWKAADVGVLVDMRLMNAATRPDYALDGWYASDGIRWEESYPISLEYCDRDADGNPIRAYDAPYKNYAYTLTLTAKWKMNVTASVVYDLNGGSGNIADDASYPFNSTVKISDATPTPPDSQIFTGWLDSAGTLHNPGDSFDFSDMALRTIRDGENVIILTAQYMTPGNVTITFDTDGGSAIAPITGDAGTPVEKPDSPVRTGYEFVGWDAPIPATIPTADMTLKAEWKINRYTLTFDTGRGTPIEPVTQEYGTAVSVSDPALTGYAFDGWTPELPTTMPAENMTVTAKWTPNRYTLTFDTNGGSVIEAITDIYGAWIAPPSAPVKDGCAFDGWDPEIPASMPAENMTVTAQWKKILSVAATGYSGVYDGQSHGITVAAPAGTAVTYSETENGAYGATNPTYKNAGEYVVYYKVTADGAAPVTGSAVVRIAKATLLPELTLVDRHNTERVMNAWTYKTPHGIPKLVVRRESPAILQGPLAFIASLFAGQGEIVTDYGAVDYRCKENGYDYGILSDADVEALSVGEYTLRVDIAESANYYAAFAETSFRVTKAPHDDITIGPITVAAGTPNLTADLSAYLVDGASCAAGGTSGNLAAPDSASVTDSGTAVRFDTAAVSGDAQGAVKVNVSSRNYQDYAITVQLTAGEAFTLRFDSAGGSAVTQTRTLRAGELLGALPTTTRIGYTFAGWYADALSDAPFTAQSAMPGVDTTLSAHWTPNSYTVTLRYLYGGMTQGNSEWTAVEGSYNETYKAYETWVRSFRPDSESFTLPEPIRNGYAFLGWTDANGKSAMSVTIPQGTAENLVYDAVWKIGDRHGEVTFVKEALDSNVLGFVGLTQDLSEASTQRSDTFSDSGYDATDAAHTMRAIAAADETPVAEDATKNVKAELYGKTLPNFAGRGDADLSADERQLQREQNDIYAAVKSVFKDDDTMKVDYMDIRVKKTVTVLKDDSMEHDETYLSATPTVEIPLRYDLTGRYNPQIARYHNGAALLFHRLDERPTDLTHMDGYYYVSEWGSNAVIYIYSEWFSTFAVATSGVENYSVRFETDGGTSVPDQIIPTSGTRKAVQPDAPSKSGYAFNGWRLDGAEQDFDFDTPITGNLTLYAQWTANPTPTPAPTPSGGGSGSGGGGGGGGGSAPKYNITAQADGNGTVKTSLTRAEGGTPIKVTPTPEEGYSLQSLTVRTSGGQEMSITQNSDGSFRYIQPASDVVVTGVFVKSGASDTSDTPDASGASDTPPGNESVPDTEHPASPNETGVSDWLITDSHPVYIKGFSDGTFRPYGNVTRAQVAIMFYRLLKNQNVSGTASFRDMTGNEWYAEAVYTLAKLGVIQGYKDGAFHGNDSISRAAFTAIACRFLKVNGQPLPDSVRFSDVPESHWAHEVITRAAAYGWIGGYQDGSFRPADPITRAAVTAIINRMLNRVADKDYVEAHFAELLNFSDTPDRSAWYFYNMMEACNEHTFDTDDDGQERWN